MSHYVYHVHVSTSSVSFRFVSHFKLFKSLASLNSDFDLHVAWRWVETVVLVLTP